MNPWQIERELTHLHPAMRRAVVSVNALLGDEKSPFRVFETSRSPHRQHWLFKQGRTREGKKVTNADAWGSYHQYGLAVDFALRRANGWSWNATSEEWDFLHRLGRLAGLEPISWEKPHLQIAGLTVGDLKAGIFPDLKQADGDPSGWREWLEAQVASYPIGAPPIAALKLEVS